MPESQGHEQSNPMANRRQESRQRTSSTDQATAGAGLAYGVEGALNPWAGPPSNDFSQNTFERHAAILGDSRMVQPMYARQRAMIMQQLQRDYGNQYVQRLVKHISGQRSEAAQTKLTVSQPGDKYEQEADRVADQVVGTTASTSQEPAQRTEQESLAMHHHKAIEASAGGFSGQRGMYPVWETLTPSAFARRAPDGIQRCQDGQLCEPCSRGECSHHNEGSKAEEVMQPKAIPTHQDSGGVCGLDRHVHVLREWARSEHGRRYVQRLADHIVQRKALAVQTKLTVSRRGDKYEQEADRVAEQVMRMPKTEPLDEEATPEGLAVLEIICPDCKDELLQAKEASGQRSELTPDIESKVSSLKGGGQPLSDATRAFFEPRFGIDFSNVRVHTDARASGTAKEMNALAYTVGPHIAFAPGQYMPDSPDGRRLLAHELTHVVQQNPEAGDIQKSSGTSKTSRDDSASISQESEIHHKDHMPVKISMLADSEVVHRHTKEDCDELYESCCDGCRRLPNRTKADKARRALCWSTCMAEYAACLASSEEALMGILTLSAIAAAIALAAADGPFPIGDAAGVAILSALGISL